MRKIAREVGRQLRTGMDADRLRHRLTARFVGTSPSQIPDPGRWLLGVALPRWGCGHFDCESGVMWSTDRRCEVCADIVADRRQDEGLYPKHGTRPGPSGTCPAGEREQLADQSPAPVAAPRGLEERPRGNCGECGARIFWEGRALADGLCRLCRAEVEGRAPCSAWGGGSRRAATL